MVRLGQLLVRHPASPVCSALPRARCCGWASPGSGGFGFEEFFNRKKRKGELMHSWASAWMAADCTHIDAPVGLALGHTPHIPHKLMPRTRPNMSRPIVTKTRARPEGPNRRHTSACFGYCMDGHGLPAHAFTSHPIPSHHKLMAGRTHTAPTHTATEPHSACPGAMVVTCPSPGQACTAGR